MDRGRVIFAAAAAALAVCCLILYYPCLGFGFLGDDFLDLNHQFSTASFSSFEAGGFRPLMVAVWALDSRIYGPLRAWGWHVTNLLLHIANILLLLMLIRQMGLDKWTSLAALAFFALSFSVVPSVCRVSGRTTLAALVPLLGAMNLHLMWLRKRRRVYLILSLLLVLASLMTKETALACPLVFAALGVFHHGSRQGAPKVFLRNLLVYMVPVAVYGVWRLAAVGTMLGYAESSSIGPYMIRNITLLAAGTFSPWLSGLSARMALIVLVAAGWMLRGKDGLGLLGLFLIFTMLITVSNLPARSYYAYAALPGTALLFASLTRICRDRRGLLAALPVLLILGSFLESRDEVGRMSQVSQYTQDLLDSMAELVERTPGDGPIIVSGIRTQLAGYGTLWPGAFEEALTTRDIRSSRRVGFQDEYFWEVMLPMVGEDGGDSVYFAQFSSSGWRILPFFVSDRNWIGRECVLNAAASNGAITVSDTLRQFNSCYLVTSGPCSLGVMDPLSNTVSVLNGVRQAGDTAWFDLENSRAWLLSETPFQLYILSGHSDQSATAHFSFERIWLGTLEERRSQKNMLLPDQHR